MPALCGIIGSASSPGADSLLGRMLAPLSRRPHLASDHAAFPALDSAAGWVWDGQTGGAGHAWNPTRDLFIAFSGDLFGSGSAASDPAAHCLGLFKKSGVRFVERLNGSFSGLLVNFRDQSLSLFNDRFGQGRIYYHQSPAGFHFSSEAKSLLAILPRLRELDPRGVAEYFAVGCPLQNRTLFRDIFLLPPASFWTFHQDGRVEKQTYFNPATWESQPKLEAESHSTRLFSHFAKVTPSLSAPSGSQAAPALSLTGGFDSRIILAWAKAAPGSLPCYTFGGPYRDCADVRIARRLAAAASQPHQTIRVGPDFLPQFPGLAEESILCSDGAMDVSGAVELYVNRIARGISPVRLTGNYGSEILRSHVAFKPRSLDTSLFTPELAALLPEAAQTYRAEAACHPLTFIAFKQVPWFHHARRSLEQSELSVRSPYLDNDLVSLVYRSPDSAGASAEALFRLCSAGNPALDPIPTDRALRRRAIPVFSPLAGAVQQFTVRAEYACDYGLPNSFARIEHVLSPLHLDRLFLGRHKFYHFRGWYKHQLAGFLQSVSVAEPPFCRPGALRSVIDDHLLGRRNRTLDLHRLLSLHLVQKLLLTSA